MRFVEDNFALGQMGTPSDPDRDATVTSIADTFKFSIRPRKFVEIPSSLNAAHFLHEPVTYAPVDRE